MGNKHGDFVWYELMTSDSDAATAFYGPLLNWKIANPAQDGFDYREIQAEDDGYIGGMLQITLEMQGAQPGWIGYIHVDNVDASIASVTAAGGTLFMPARDMEGVGRFAMVADPQGAAFYVMTSSTGETSNAFAATAVNPGHCAWNELATSDPAAALAFYGDQFGWIKDGEMDMGPMGTYAMIRHEHMLGGMMKRPPEMPVSAWTFYFRVPNIDVAAAFIESRGGTVIAGPMEIPGGDFSINGIDPQGAHFAIVGAR